MGRFRKGVRRFAPRGAGAWAALARSGLLPACEKWRSRRASCWLALTSFTTRWALPRRMRRRRFARRSPGELGGEQGEAEKFGRVTHAFVGGDQLDLVVRPSGCQVQGIQRAD